MVGRWKERIGIWKLLVEDFLSTVDTFQFVSGLGKLCPFVLNIEDDAEQNNGKKADNNDE